MKKALFIGLSGVLIATNCFAISLADGLKSSGLKVANSHSHLTTNPVKIYAITVTPTSANGFAQIIETNSAWQDNSYTASLALGTTGVGYITGQESKVKADIRGATANNSITVSYPHGISVAEQSFVDCQDADCEIYYKE